MVLLWHALCCKSLYTFPTLHKTHKCVTEAKQLVNHRHKTLLHTLYRPTLSVKPVIYSPYTQQYYAHLMGCCGGGGGSAWGNWIKTLMQGGGSAWGNWIKTLMQGGVLYTLAAGRPGREKR